MLILFANSFAIKQKENWDDTVRVAIIWNRGTGSDGMPDSWQQAIGEIGDSTRSFVEKSIKSIPNKNIKVFSGSSSDWEDVAKSVNNLKSKFDGRLPHTIVYINLYE